MECSQELNTMKHQYPENGLHVTNYDALLSLHE